MDKLTRIERGVRCCMTDEYVKNCTQCPYSEMGEDTLDCESRLAQDVLALLQAARKEGVTLE